jgi:hypothetical protein
MGCNYTSDCYSEYGLVCNSGSTCNCPENSLLGMCDCIQRTITNEYFWNGNSCQLANSYGLTCTNSSTTYMCKYMKEGTSCVQSSPGVYTCECPVLQYFNPDGYCTNQTLVNTNCSATSKACRSDLGLICLNGLCVCNSTQFWLNSITGCRNYYIYGQSPCSADNQCASTLICNNGSNTPCTCPSLLSSGYCDCYRSHSIEYFWNGNSCQLANSYGLTCTNSSTTYMCKYMKEGTSCVQSTPGVYTCECPVLQYFNPDGYCTNQTLVNTNCSATSKACRRDLGLICSNGLCVCNSTQFWLNSITGCRNYYTYGQSSCSADNQCASTLICNNGSNTPCTCPSSLSSGYCDCYRSHGNESFWDGSVCFAAKSYSQSCSNGQWRVTMEAMEARAPPS